MDPNSPSRPPSAPFIVTAELPVDIFSWSNGLRAEHFPPERNFLRAHVTLFHAFAPSLRAELLNFLPRIAGEFAPPEAEVTGLLNFGGGTALAIESPSIQAIRDQLAERFWDMLSKQDQAPKRLHITIQNKVSNEAAKALQAQLGPTLQRRRFAFTGLGLHLYRNPVWDAVGRWSFRGKVSA